MKGTCTGTTKAGAQCRRSPIAGARVCGLHGGAAPQVRAKAVVRAELMNWGLDSPTVDPGETLLKLVSQSAARAAHYASLLEQAYDAAERLRRAHEAGELFTTREDSGPDDDRGESPAVQQAREDLDRVFAIGGVAALVGNTYGASSSGSVYATGEAVRGLVVLEAQERERCAGWCIKAIAAGLAERQVRLAERQGALLADALRAVMGDASLGLSEEQRRAMPGVIRRHLSAIST